MDYYIAYSNMQKVAQMLTEKRFGKLLVTSIAENRQLRENFLPSGLKDVCQLRNLY